MPAVRIGLTALLLLAFWSALVGLFHSFYDQPMRWLWVLPPLLVAVQWALGPWLLRGLYRVTWCSPQQFESLYRMREKYLHIGVVETSDPWAMTFGHARRRVNVLLTSGLLQLLAEQPDQLNAILDRELFLGDQADLGAASALAGPLVWCGVTDEFFLGGGRQSAVERGLGGGLYIGVLARVLYHLLERMAAVALRGRQQRADPQGSPHWDAALRALCKTLQGPTPTMERSLQRAYMARMALLCPVDVAELGRLSMLDGDLETAAGQALSNPWERGVPRFHAPLGERLGVAPAAVDERYRASWQAAGRRSAVRWLLIAAGVADVVLRHTDLGVPIMAIGLGWLVGLQGRYATKPEVIAVEPGGPAPWYSQVVARVGEGWLPLWWPPLLNVGVSPTPPSIAAGAAVRGWIRYEAVPLLELERVDRTVNRASLVRVLMASAVVAMGVLLNLATAWY